MLLTNGLKYHYARLWNEALILPKRKMGVHAQARRIATKKPRYMDAAHHIEMQSGGRLAVPWWVIGCLHLREGNGAFGLQILNGERYAQTTRLWPEGLGPWETWEDSAREAFKRAECVGWIMPRDKRKWSVQEVLYLCESWNGWGYMMYHPETPSPYLWEDTTIDGGKPGKYTRDGYFDPTADDKQVGIAAIMLALVEAEIIAPLVVEDVNTGPGQDSLEDMGRAGRTFEVLGLQRHLNTLPHGRNRLEEDGIYGPKTKAVHYWLEIGTPF